MCWRLLSCLSTTASAYTNSGRGGGDCNNTLGRRHAGRLLYPVDHKRALLAGERRTKNDHEIKQSWPGQGNT